MKGRIGVVLVLGWRGKVKNLSGVLDLEKVTQGNEINKVTNPDRLQVRSEGLWQIKVNLYS